MTGHVPSDDEITSHLGYQGKSNVVSWIKPDNHFKDDDLARKGIQLVELNSANKYYLVVVEVIGTPSTLNIVVAITNDDIMVHNPSNWSVFLVDLAERICSFLRVARFLCMNVSLPS